MGLKLPGLFECLMLPLRAVRRFATLFAVSALVLSIGFNIAVLTVSGVFSAASGVLSAAGLTTVAAGEAGEKRAHRKATGTIVRQTAAGVTARVRKGAARNVASVAGEAVPVVGIAIIAGALAYDVADACETPRDMAALEAALLAETEPEAASAAAREDFDCRSIIPNYNNLPTSNEIYAAMRAGTQRVWDASVLQIDRLKAANVTPADDVWDSVTGTIATLPGFDDLKQWWSDEEGLQP